MRGSAFVTSCLIGILLQCLPGVGGRCLGNEPLHRRGISDDQPRLVPRDLDKCTAPTAPRLLREREVERYDVDNATHLAPDLIRRVMVEPEGYDKASMNTFMKNEVAEAYPIVWPNNAGSSQNTGLIELFGNEAISAGLNRLSGCTALVIISKTGYFAGHYWESISFDPNPEWKFKSREIALQRSVLDAITNGKGGANPDHPSLKRKAGTFADDSVVAFLIKPHMSTDQAPEAYRPAWDKIKATVGSCIPGLDPITHADRWTEVTYTKLDRDAQQLRRSAAGHVVIKYDPDHPENSGKRKVSLWVEWSRVFDRSW